MQTLDDMLQSEHDNSDNIAIHDNINNTSQNIDIELAGMTAEMELLRQLTTSDHDDVIMSSSLLLTRKLIHGLQGHLSSQMCCYQVTVS